MTTVAPPNMVKAVDEFYAADHSSLINDGIDGDTSHLAKAKTSGTYHISAQDCGFQYGHLYSLQRPEDIAGGKANPTFASAHDIGGNQADRITVTKRVLAAFYAKDPRLVGVAEFAGTTTGTSVHACYPNTWTDDRHNNGGWDAGHYENHCHVSFKRDHCNNYASIKAFMDIVAGLPAEQEEDMALTPEDVLTLWNTLVPDGLVAGGKGAKHTFGWWISAAARNTQDIKASEAAQAKPGATK